LVTFLIATVLNLMAPQLLQLFNESFEVTPHSTLNESPVNGEVKQELTPTLNSIYPKEEINKSIEQPLMENEETVLNSTPLYKNKKIICGLLLLVAASIGFLYYTELIPTLPYFNTGNTDIITQQVSTQTYVEFIHRQDVYIERLLLKNMQLKHELSSQRQLLLGIINRYREDSSECYHDICELEAATITHERKLTAVLNKISEYGIEV